MLMTGDHLADWVAAREALCQEVARVVTLLRVVAHPEAPALGQWNLAEVAMHLSQAWSVVPGLARDDLSKAYEAVPNLAGRQQGSALLDSGTASASGAPSAGASSWPGVASRGWAFACDPSCGTRRRGSPVH